MMTRYTIVSTDCHAGPPHATGGFLDHVDPRYREPLRRDMAQARDMIREIENLFDADFRAQQDRAEVARGLRLARAPSTGRVALVTIHDLDETVKQITWAREHGLRGVLDDVPHPERRAILAENAARLYGFDLERVDALAAALPPGAADL